jgi:uncharacterized phage-associated protein
MLDRQTLDCHKVADYFLALTNEDEGDLISNLKLQKLMYYAQGLHLAVRDAPIFPERIEAWRHGPVVPELYYAKKDFGSGPLPKPENIDFSQYDDATRSILDEVYSVFGQFAAWKLANMTHEEEPWKEAAENCTEISHESLKTFFRSQITHG